MISLYKEWFDLDDRGSIIWKKTGRGIKVGAPAALSLGKNGYQYVWLRYKRHLAHRVIFSLYFGYLPEMVDHEDRNPLNNKVCNLREATAKKNVMNSTPRKGCASRFKGVARKRSKWRAYLTKDGHTYQLGVFTEEVDAALAYDKKATELFGSFAKLNFGE